MSKFLDEAARITGCTTSHANGGGTNRFFAPELLEDQPKTLETDMWAFGCLIAQILTGCIPYEEITQTMAVIWAINQCQAPMNNQDGKIEGALWNCLVNCWSQAPSDRPSVSQVNQLLKVVEPEPSLLVIPQELERDIIPLDLSGRVDISGRSASGGYSDIYRGTLRTTTEEMEVAIKQLRVLDSSYRKSKTTPAEHHKKRFLREVAVWRDLHHPNIVPLLGYALDSRGTLGLVSPWYPNGNVADYLRSTPSSSTQRASINLIYLQMRDIANGLAYLHSIPMVHGDLKATNVFVTEGCRASLGDFGMSRILDEALHVHGLTTSQAYTGGTVRYMAPELVIENPKSSASDIWAFGCLVMQIATGTDPYNEQQNTFGVLRAILDGVPPMTNHGEQIGTILWDSLQKCWSMEPANRPTASELCAFLEELEVGPEAKG
ncbi:hypothetical protein FRC02_000248 [Tulasnella sp. 418]|nr:hypothetical protein FRC02_000248 [Tulasnella sp. 418]